MSEATDNISRHTLSWLLLCNIAVLLPLIDKAAVATLGICGICFVWRIGIYFGRVAKPPRWLVTTLAIAAGSTLLLVSREIGMLNALINLLILGYALKYIEMRERRDILAIVLAGYFLIALAFIDKQGISDALLSLLVCAINTATLLSVYRGQQAWLLQGRQALILMLQSLPLAVALFVILPRLSPLWLVPQSKSATTGLSDQLRIGDITQLTRSQALAFRVTFDGKAPAAPQLYWRAMVLSDYDGQTWQQAADVRDINWYRPYAIKEALAPTTGATLNYTVIAERSSQHWLFALDRATSSTRAVKNLTDYRLVALKPVEQQFQYQVQSQLDAALDDPLSTSTLRENLAVPLDRNPQTLALAQQLKAQYPEPRQRLAAMMQLFNQQPFYYTLSPQPLGQHQLDDFLFSTRQGFCVHYASAFTMLARASGLPARIVAGYQGGIYNASAGYMSVYQYMAHAWAEVWLDGQGWVRYDPTAMIAPERIEQGFDSLFSPEESYLADASFSAIRNSSWFNALRQQFANLDYYWTVWVLGFNEQRQQQLLAKLLGEVTPLRIALFLISVITIVLLVIAWSTGLLRLPSRQSVVDRHFNAVAKASAKAGVKRELAMGPMDFTALLQQHWPKYHRQLNDWNNCYLQLKYQSLSTNELKAITLKFTNKSKEIIKIISRNPVVN